VSGPATEEPVDRFDQWVDELFDQYLRGRPVADRLFYAASALGDHGVIWLILAAAQGLRSDDHWRGALRAAAGISVESASSAFFAAALLSEGDPALRPLYYAIAVVVALSRIHVRIHHASDVAAGIGLGAVLGEIARRLMPWPGTRGSR